MWVFFKPDFMKVFLTGANGFLGQNILQKLLKENHEVVALCYGHSTLVNQPGLSLINGTVENNDLVLTSSRGCNVFIHAAATTSLWPPRHPLHWNVNLKGTQNMLETALINKADKFIHVGTANSFGPGKKSNPGNENTPYICNKYKLDYFDSKFAAQNEVFNEFRKSGLPAVVVNPTFMLGKYLNPNGSGKLIISIHQKKVPGYTSGGRNYVNVGDVADGVYKAIHKGRNGEAYILGHQNLNFREIFEKVSKSLTAPQPRLYFPKPIALSYGAIQSGLGTLFRFPPTITYQMARLSVDEHYYSNEKAKTELEFQPAEIETGITEGFSWLKEAGLIMN
jgi:dihydroflavonol-4-reductase